MRLLHELSVHQAELEMQNEQLLSAEAEFEAALARYVDLFDSARSPTAPSPTGMISEANPASASLLACPRRP